MTVNFIPWDYFEHSLAAASLNRAMVVELEAAVHAADVMEELGYSSSVNVEHFTEFLSQFENLNEGEIARILGMVARTNGNLEDGQAVHGTFSAAMGISTTGALGEDGTLTEWNLNVVIDGLHALVQNIDWGQVAVKVDYKGFMLPDQKSFSVLLSLYSRGSGAPFPISAVCGHVWDNVEGQLSFLRYAVAAPPEIFSFANSPRTQPPVNGLHGHKSPLGTPNQAYLSLDLLEVICRLGEAGHMVGVRMLLEYPLKHCPEVLLLGLAQVKTEWDLVQSEFVPPLVTTYLSNNPNSSTVLHLLWPLNKEAITSAMVEVHAKEQSTISRLLDVCQDMKVLSVVLDTTPLPFAIDLAALASRREYLNLEKWLQDSMKVHRDSLFKACLIYLREKTLNDTKADSVQLPATAPVINLSPETTGIFFKVLQASVPLVSHELGEEMKELLATAVRHNPRLLSIGAAEQSSSETFASDIEEEANSYFQKIYVGQLTIDEFVDMLKRFDQSSVQREQETSACMIQSLFDEYRFFPRYPDKELQITAILFGSLVKHQLVSSVSLGIALRCVLEALRKPPGSKMFSFGMIALEQFLDRLVEWPQYCAHILQIDRVKEAHPDLEKYMERASAQQLVNQTELGPTGTVHQAPQGSEKAHDAENASLPTYPSQPTDISSAEQESKPVEDKADNLVEEDVERLSSIVSTVEDQAGIAAYAFPQQPEGTSDLVQQEALAEDAQHQPLQPSDDIERLLQVGPPPGGKPQPVQSSQGTTGSKADGQNGPIRVAPTRTPPSTFGHALNIETLVLAAEKRENPMEIPSSDIQDKVAFIINNLSVTNLDTKAKEMLDVLTDNLYPWFAQYMVMKRASIEPNFHELYVKFLDKMALKPLQKEVLKASYENCKVLLWSDLIKGSSEERSLLKNLGSWLGKLTIGRNQALRAREIDPKTLIIEAYEKGLMIAIIPFTSKILEPCQTSLAYQPPNPWTMGILGLLAEIYAMPDLKMNLKFDIEVLFKKLGVELKDVKPTQLLVGRQRETEGNPDFSNKDGQVQALATEPEARPSSAEPGAHTPAKQSTPGGSLALPLGGAETDLPLASAPSQLLGTLPLSKAPATISQVSLPMSNLAAYIVYNPKLAGVSQQLQLTRIVPVAMERAIRDIMTPVVERSVAIACQTTKELVLKDYAMEADESRTYKAGHLMVASLAGSLAHVTCKDTLRMSMANNFRDLLGSSGLDIEQTVQVLINDNLDLGCAVIEKAATEKAQRELDGNIAPQLSVRRQQRESSGQSTFDSTVYSQGNLARLPEALRPKPGQLTMAQQRVYEDFARLPWQNQPAPTPPPAAVISSGQAGLAATPPSMVPVLPAQQQGAPAHSSSLSHTPAAASSQANGQHTMPSVNSDADRSLPALVSTAEAAQPSVDTTLAFNQAAASSTEDSRGQLEFSNKVGALFDEWKHISDSVGGSDKAYAAYISNLQASGMLKDDESADHFFQHVTELAVTQCLTANSSKAGPDSAGPLSFVAIDAYAKLVVLLVKYYVDPSGNLFMSKISLFNKVLGTTVRVVQKDAEKRGTQFSPRPYFRLFISWLTDFNSSDPALDSSNFQALTACGSAFVALQPSHVPGFSFAWLELISHRLFMPKLLLANSQKGWPLFQRLIVALFKFMEPYLRNADLSEPVRLLYKGTLRVLLVLLHDFPEFLCDHHFSLCDVIPPSCTQMRNLILSAFPRNMRLPDPFTPNLKVDLLPEINQPPRILSDVEGMLRQKQMKSEVDEYLKTRQPSSFLAELGQQLLLPKGESLQTGTRYNVPLINSLVLSVGMQAIQQLQAKTTPQQLAVPTPPITHSAPMDIFQRLIIDLDTEGRYLFLNAIANQLRYPNNLTHYFSCVLLYLFAEASQEVIQEQITRVLLERLIVNRPHPWGLLITFIELIKNPRYNFWQHGFTRCAPEIEKLFESVARSCMGPTAKPGEDDMSVNMGTDSAELLS